DGVELIRAAKAKGIHVSAEATPHHLTLTDEACDGYRTEAKVNPPLRSEGDRDAVIQGLVDGTLDVIATDHAPHHYDEKEQAFEDAPFGLVGLETALGIVLTHIFAKKLLSLTEIVDRMSCAPARAFNLPGGTLREGAPADITVFDPHREWIVNPTQLLSKSKNTPFAGWRLTGRATLTVVGGRIVWEAK
ncbi:MAG TPA: amidohydrolase family protein, partial [Longimicrobiales bacterium]